MASIGSPTLTRHGSGYQSPFQGSSTDQDHVDIPSHDHPIETTQKKGWIKFEYDYEMVPYAHHFNVHVYAVGIIFNQRLNRVTVIEASLGIYKHVTLSQDEVPMTVLINKICEIAKYKVIVDNLLPVCALAETGYVQDQYGDRLTFVYTCKMQESEYNDHLTWTDFSKFIDRPPIRQYRQAAIEARVKIVRKEKPLKF